MERFNYLKKLDVDEQRTAEYELWEIQEDDKPVPVLVLAPSGTANKPYFHALLNRTNRVRRVGRGQGISKEQIKANRDDDRELFPQFVVKSWRNVVESNGNECPFTRGNCDDFLKVLPDWLFDKVRTFTAEPENFLGTVPVPEEVAENLLEGSGGS